jgi:hypothetical protein
MFSRETVWSNFRTPRYERLNQVRWDHFIGMGIPLKGKTIFEPGAGVGDQTEWLLNQGVKHVTVNDGREENLQIIRERFGHDPRVTTVCGNIETFLPTLDIYVDFIYFYGVYYHLNESAQDFHIMRDLSKRGQAVAFDFHAGNNVTDFYNGDSPSTSLSQYGLRVNVDTLMKAMKEIWGHAYLPKIQLDWQDPTIPHEVRLVAVGSHVSLDDNPNLVPV